MMHVAQALNIPVVGIYGPFPGNIRLDTYKNVEWLDCKLHCAPCFMHGNLPCKNSSQEGYSKCYEQLDIEEFENKVDEMTG